MTSTSRTPNDKMTDGLRELSLIQMADHEAEGSLDNDMQSWLYSTNFAVVFCLTSNDHDHLSQARAPRTLRQSVAIISHTNLLSAYRDET